MDAMKCKGWITAPISYSVNRRRVRASSQARKKRHVHLILFFLTVARAHKHQRDKSLRIVYSVDDNVSLTVRLVKCKKGLVT